MISRKSKDLLPITTRKWCCKMPNLGTEMKENILQKVKKTPSIDSCLVRWFLICCFRRVSVLCLKARRQGGLRCWVFSFKITKGSCDRTCSAVIYMVIDTAISQRWGTTFFLRGKMYKHIFFLSHTIESFKGRTNLFFPWVKVRVIWEIKWLYVPLVAVQLASISEVPPLCLIAHL